MRPGVGISDSRLLLATALLAYLPWASDAMAEESVPPDGQPARILFGQTGQMDPQGTLRASSHEILFGSVSFVPLENMELQVLGIMFLDVPKVTLRYRFLDLEHIDAAAAVGWGFGSYSPLAELAVTGIWDGLRINLCGRYVMVPDTYWNEELYHIGIDDVLLSGGVEWRLNRWFSPFLEATLIVPMLREGMTLHYYHPIRQTPGPTGLIVAGGSRFILGRWSLEAAVVNLLFPWVAASVAFDLY